MIGWRFLLSRRWAGYVVVTIVFAVVCVLLGCWQLARRAEALAEIAKIESNYDAHPVPVTEALPELDSFDDSQKWLPVIMTGQYLVSDQLLVRNRVKDAQPGFKVLTPLQMADGNLFLVDRGWLPTGQVQDLPDNVPAPPLGQVTVVARLKPSEPSLGNRSAPAGQIATIELPLVAELVSKNAYTGAYGLLVSEDPAPETKPAGSTRPVEDEGPHLSYTFQWFVFALLGCGFLGYLMRQEYRALNESDPHEQSGSAKRERKRAVKARSDGEIEDEILDSMSSRR